MKQFKKLGFLVVSVGQRGMQGMNFLGSPKLPSPCDSEGLREITDYLHSTYCSKGRKLYSLGFSIGGNALCKLAGEDGENCKYDAIYCC